MNEAEPSVFALVAQLAQARAQRLTLTEDMARLLRCARLQEATALKPALMRASREVQRLEQALAARQLDLFTTKEG